MLYSLSFSFDIL